MPAIETLEANLRANPDDWSSWLVYADWLTDQGDIRGKLIQLGHKLATAALSERERQALEHESRELEREHQQECMQNLLLPRDMFFQWRFGFVLTAEADSDCQWAIEALETLAGHPAGRLLSGVSLVGIDLDDEEAVDLAQCQFLRGLPRLKLTWNGLGPEGITALAHSGALSSVTQLVLDENEIGPLGAAALADAPSLGSLAVLGLRACCIGDEGARALANASALRSLTKLSLRDNGIGDEGAMALARSERLERLTDLDLSANAIGPAGAAALRRLAHLTLDLRGNPIEEEA